jgi:dihydroflavonol-4-reductase
MEQVAVSGASGFIGSAVVRKLLAQGRQVRVLLEPGATTKNLDGLPLEGLSGEVERFTVDVCDFEGMARALDGCSAFYHLAAIYQVWTPDPTAIHRVNIEGTTTALLAAKATRVPRVVYTSSIAAVGLPGDGTPADESVAYNLHDVANDYILTKHLSERIAMRFAEAGTPIVVVNPAFPFGPRDIAPTPTGSIILSLLRGQVPAVGDGGFCAIDVDDVAAAHVAAETRGRVGERYILGNHNISFRDFCELVCRIAGVKAPSISVPGWVGQSIAKGMELWADRTGKAPPTTVKGLRYLQMNAFFDNTKARTELELQCTPLEDSVRRAVDYFRAEGMV